MKTCIDCEYHKVIEDPDPNDWFCDDDKAVVCTLEQNDTRDSDSEYASNRNPYKCITVSCRPHHIIKESTIPDWCTKGDNPNA